jgi:hypothetical protein
MYQKEDIVKITSHFFAHSLCAFSFLATVFSGHAWDFSGIKKSVQKSYLGLLLTPEIYAIADAKTADWCNEGAQVTKIAQEKVLEKYATPRWVTWLNAIPRKESMFDYAYDIYKKIQLEIDELMQLIDRTIDKDQLSQASQEALEGQQAAWRALYHEKLIHVLGEGAVKFEPTEKSIFNNVKASLDFLDALIPVLEDLTIAPPTPITSASTQRPTIKTPNIPAHKVVSTLKMQKKTEVVQYQETQQSLNVKKEKLKKDIELVRTRLGFLITKDICGKEKLAKPQLGWFERWHRKKQAEWLADYVNNVCSVCKIR